MKCSAVQKRILEYIEAELGRPGARALPERLTTFIKAHLDSCAACREEAKAIADSLTIANMAGDVDPAVGFKLRTVALLKQEAERRRPTVPFAVRMRPALVPLAVFVVMGALLLFFLPEGPESIPVASDVTEFEEEVERHAQEIEFLAGTLSRPDETTPYVERVHLEKILVLAGSIDECWDAFEKNPGCERIRTALLTQMRQEVEALKAYYEVRSLSAASAERVIGTEV